MPMGILVSQLVSSEELHGGEDFAALHRIEHMSSPSLHG